MPKNQHIKEMNWGFLLFRGSYTYKKGLIVQSSSKTTQLLDPQAMMKMKTGIGCISIRFNG